MLLTLAGVAFGALSLHGHAARAQIDPQIGGPLRSYGVYEARVGVPPTLVGEIVRDGADRTTYTEHWVLYPRYVNPNGTNGVVLVIRPGLREYRDLNDFFARVPFERGARYVHVDCLDTEDPPTLPR